MAKLFEISNAKRPIEAVLFAIGTLCLAYCGLASFRMLRAQHEARALVATPTSSAQVTASKADDLGSVIGEISIPLLGVTEPIVEGVRSDDLGRGVGRIPGTADLGGVGTVALAGHRDTVFRTLNEVLPGMLITLKSRKGTFRYFVESTEVVAPTRVDVLRPKAKSELLLITCFPFVYVGAAPERFLVHAKQIT